MKALVLELVPTLIGEFELQSMPREWWGEGAFHFNGRRFNLLSLEMGDPERCAFTLEVREVPQQAAVAASRDLEPSVKWRGSVSDLATDLAPLLGPLAVGRLIDELQAALRRGDVRAG